MTFMVRQSDLPEGLIKRTGFGGTSSYRYVPIRNQLAVQDKYRNLGGIR